jgi:hypothetical protein
MRRLVLIMAMLGLLTACKHHRPTVIYASAYSGTVDQRVNACITDAISTSVGICDATDVTGSLTGEIEVGNHNQQAVTVMLPKAGEWISSIDDGHSCAIRQYSNTAIVGSNTGNPHHAAASSQFSITTPGGLKTGPWALYCTEPATEATNGGSYVRISGVAFFNVSNAPMAGGASFIADGWFDNSIAESVLVFDGRNSAAIARGLCCSATFRNVSLDGLQTAPAPTLLFANTASQYNIGFVMDGLSVTHPGPGHPNIACAHTGGSTWRWWDSITIHDLYMEGNNTDLYTPHIQCDSVMALAIDGFTDERMNSGSTAYALQLTNTAAPYVKGQVVIDNFLWSPGSGTSTNAIDDQVHGSKANTVTLGVSSGAGGLVRYAAP